MNVKWSMATMLLAASASMPAWGEDATPIPRNGTVNVPFGFTDTGPIATEAGSGLYGMGKFASGVGDYNLKTAQATVELQKARALAIANHKQAVENWYDLKQQNREFRADKLQPLSPEQLSHVIESQRPARLTARQYDALTGKLWWPAALQGHAFDADRAVVEHAFENRTTRDSGPESVFYAKIRLRTERMLAGLRDRIELFSPSEFMAAKKFLLGLKYEALSPANPTAVAMRD